MIGDGLKISQMISCLVAEVPQFCHFNNICFYLDILKWQRCRGLEKKLDSLKLAVCHDTKPCWSHMRVPLGLKQLAKVARYMLRNDS